MKKFIIPIVILLLLGFSYAYYTQTSSQGQTGSLISQNGSIGTNTATIAVGAEIISLLDKLDRIQLDTKLFKEQTFQSLRDFSITLRPQPVGRPNPFAQIGNETGGASGSVSSPSSASVAPSNTQTPSNQTPVSGRIVNPGAPSLQNTTSNNDTTGATAPDSADDAIIPIEGE